MPKKNSWKETVRDLYDDLHFGKRTVFNDETARMVVAFIEERHQEYFCAPPKHGKT